MCARWGVALEMNCFPSRLDLSPHLLAKAVEAGCAISLGSDAHARSHSAEFTVWRSSSEEAHRSPVLNRFSHSELRQRIADTRAKRKDLKRSTPVATQREFHFDAVTPRRITLEARIQPPQNIPDGSLSLGLI